MRDKGLSCVADEHGTVTSVQLHCFAHEGYSRYTGPVPGNLQFSMKKTEVRALLGEPHQSGEATEIPVLGRKPPWDTFLVGNIRVHVEYVDGCKAIQMVSLTKRPK